MDLQEFLGEISGRFAETARQASLRPHSYFAFTRKLAAMALLRRGDYCAASVAVAGCGLDVLATEGVPGA